VSNKFNIIFATGRYNFTLQGFIEHFDLVTGVRSLKTFVLQQLPASTADVTSGGPGRLANWVSIPGAQGSCSRLHAKWWSTQCKGSGMKLAADRCLERRSGMRLRVCGVIRTLACFVISWEERMEIWIKVDQLDDTCFIMSIYCSTCFGC